jgi:hypothetical protein
LASACPTSNRQKGFKEAQVCSENLLVIDGLLRKSKQKGTPLAMVFIDLAKAFDSVSHKHIQWVLTERKVDLIGHCYHVCSTRVRTGRGFTPETGMKIGVKQGEPLSPLLFNLAIDPLLGALEGLGRGFRYGEENIRVIAYADDLVLLSDSWSGMARNIGILEAFYELSGLRVNPAKCQGFLIAKGKRTVGGINDCPEWKLCGEGISMVAAGEYIKYLGVEISPWKGIKQPDLLTSIADAPLKPTQKVEVLCE